MITILGDCCDMIYTASCHLMSRKTFFCALGGEFDPTRCIFVSKDYVVRVEGNLCLKRLYCVSKDEESEFMSGKTMLGLGCKFVSRKLFCLLGRDM